MVNFTVEETNLINIFATNTKDALISDLQLVCNSLYQGEREIQSLVERTVKKLSRISDNEYSSLVSEPATEWEE